jgi:hypothetical protein
VTATTLFDFDAFVDLAVFVDLATVFVDLATEVFPRAPLRTVPAERCFAVCDGIAAASTPEPTTRPRRTTPMTLNSLETKAIPLLIKH